MEQSILQQAPIKALQTISLPQAHHHPLQDEAHHQHQTPSTTHLPETQPQSLTKTTLKRGRDRENQQHFSRKDARERPHGQGQVPSVLQGLFKL